MVDCEIHGLSFIAPVSPRVSALLDASARVSPGELVRFRFPGEFPWVRGWADRATAGDIDEHLLSFERAAGIANEGSCSGCLKDWLRGLGVDVALSVEEQRFIRIHDAVLSILRPILESELDRVAALLRAQRDPVISGCGFDSKRSRPFEANFAIIRQNKEGFLHDPREGLSIALDDEGERLVGSVANPFFPNVATPPLLEIPLSAGELLADAHDALEQWGHYVRHHLEQCT